MKNQSIYEWISERYKGNFQPSLDGKYNRFKWQSNSNNDGWFVGSIIGHNSKGEPVVIASMGSWKTGEKHVFKSYEASSRNFKKEAIRVLTEQKKIYEEEKLLIQGKAKEKANTMWSKAYENNAHDYLIKKKIPNSFGSKMLGGPLDMKKPLLLIPMKDEAGQLVGLQKILSESNNGGNKFFIKGQKTKGTFHIINEDKPKDKIYIGEGFATMATIAMADNYPCVVAFNANNLIEVAIIISRRCPDSKLIIVGDDDVWNENGENKGRKKSEEAAKICGAAAVFPKFESPEKGDTDFSDLYLKEGLDAVKFQLNQTFLFEQPERLQVIFDERQRREILNDAWKALLHRNRPEPFLFQNEGKLVRIKKRGSTLVIQPLDLSEIYGYLLREIDWLKWRLNKFTGEFELIPFEPQKDLFGKDFLAFVDESLPKLQGVITAPVLSSEGSLIVEAGYNRKEALYGDPSGLFKKIRFSKEVSYHDAIQARNFISSEIFYDFPFNSYVDKTHAFALLLQPFVRSFIGGPTPFYSIEADNHGTGKSLLARVISQIAIGSEVKLRAFPKDENEMRKNILATLLESPRMVLFDNVVATNGGVIDSPSFAGLITSEYWEDRVLQKSEIYHAVNNSTWVLTANKPYYSKELFRRRIPIQLISGATKLWMGSDFKHKNLFTWVKNNRVRVVEEILRIIQFYINTGFPRSKQSLGSFEDWSAIIGGILESIELEGFLLNFSGATEKDIEKSWEELIKVWLSTHGEKELYPHQINQICEENDILMRVRGSGNPKSQTTRIGIELSRNCGRCFSGYQIYLSQDRGHHGKLYKIVPQNTENSSLKLEIGDDGSL